jgi:glycosyltransferase involved in cell wall biosynthesis
MKQTKKLLFITDNFPPETNAPAIRTYEHCKKWVQLGVEVTIITCAPNFPEGKVYKGYKNKIIQHEKMNGINVIRVWSYITENKGTIKRTIDYISFGISSFLAGLFVKSDIIVATTPQFFTAISGRCLSFFKRKPWILEVRDLWPDSIVAVGSLKKESLIFRALKKTENRLYNSADRIVVVTDSFEDYLKNSHDINPKKIGVFKNGVTPSSLIVNKTKAHEIKSNLSLNEKTIISFIGTHGLAQGLSFILNVAKVLDHKSNNLHFLFVGDGAKKKELVIKKERLKLNNVTFIDSVSKSEVANYISLSNISLVTLRKNEEFKKVIPSKIFENIALNKPILLGVEGEAKKLVEFYGVGESFEPENKEDLIRAIKDIQKLQNSEKFYSKCQQVLKDFNRPKIAASMLKFIFKS